MRIDEVVDGLIDPNAKDDLRSEEGRADAEEEEAQIEEEEARRTRRPPRRRSRRACCSSRPRRSRSFDAHPPPLREDDEGAREARAPSDKDYLQARDQISNELMTIRFTAQQVERLCDSVRSLVDEVRRHEREIHDSRSTRRSMPRAALHQGLPGQRDGSKRWLTTRDQRAASRGREGAARASSPRSSSSSKISSTCSRRSASRSRT